MNRKALLSVALVGAFIAEHPASACMAPNFEQWVFVESRPGEVPYGLTLIQVEVPATIDRWGMIEVAVIDGDMPWHAGSRLRINPGSYSSCSRWGVVGRRAYVLGVMTFGEQGEPFLAVVQQPNPNYEHSGRD
ncbi:MAG TPA: hypothetical protein VEW04_04415 [Allosphingosinicella sp.]|nr:hypothetical protein [Allosphingosinicella sp.]